MMLAASPALARGRLPSGGKLALRLPWPVGSIDPHAIDDASAAIFGPALFDSLLPVLADDPEVAGAELRVKMRLGVVSANGRGIGARDAVFSITRAKGMGGGGWLADIPVPRRDGESLVFAMKDKERLTTALSSPLVAIVPFGFSAMGPDGTGPFRAERRGATLALVRNERAPHGPSLLDSIEITSAPDLAASLRAFEAGTDDLGWLGLGLHGMRSGAKPFDAGHVGWTILRTGKDAGSWDAPGVAQTLCDQLEPGKLAYLVPGTPWSVSPGSGWGGPPCDIIVRNDAPYLVEVARAVAAMLTRPSHEVKVQELAPLDFAAKRASRTYSLAIDVARPALAGPFGTLVGLASADDASVAADIVRHPPKPADVPARSMTRMMRIGVIGEIREQGGKMPDTNIPLLGPGFGWDLGSITRGDRR
jgi:peptide/nickel transport system substrate-binding protein